MFCPNCGTQNAPNVVTCAHCGTALAPLGMQPPAPPMAPAAAGMPAPPRPNNYLVQAILVTVFCCLPLGIVSIVFAAQVNGAFDRGDYAGADKASRQAKMWCWISFGIGGAAVLLWFLLVGLSMISAILSGSMH